MNTLALTLMFYRVVFFFNLFILVVLGLCCCVQASSSCRVGATARCGAWASRGGFSWVASLVVEPRLSGAWTA